MTEHPEPPLATGYRHTLEEWRATALRAAEQAEASASTLPKDATAVQYLQGRAQAARKIMAGCDRLLAMGPHA